ncbi:MAG: divergent polysaccharide deacetylase family protein, partial [Deltaproteobacteria bacterium]|nr:divergent polysaccharide deacetylase family protein [Deltaproteobacteria bacterium]
ADELIEQLDKNLDSVPFIKGVNNHMGSKITSTSTQMYQIFSILKKRNLFFIDSRTSSKTLCKPSARLLQLPFSQRDIFLDNDLKPDAIRKQLEKLIEVAKKHGSAIGIAHPHQATYTVLRKMLPVIKNQVQLVPASKVVHISG